MRHAKATLSLVVVLCSLSISANAKPPTDKPNQPKPGGQSPPSYTVTEIPPPPRDGLACNPDFQSAHYARRMNESLRAVGYGYCYVATGDPEAPFIRSRSTSFVWSPSTGSYDLPALSQNASDSYARDINEYGDAVGWELTDNGFSAPYWPISGGVTDAIAPTSCNYFYNNRAEDINDLGDVVGRANRVGDDGFCRTYWLLRTVSGQEIVAPVMGGVPYAMNNHRQAVGTSNSLAVMWSPEGGLVTLYAAGENESPTAWNVNDLGDAVGYVYKRESGCPLSSDAYLWEADGTTTPLSGFADAPVNVAYGINDAKWVVGYGSSNECGGVPTVTRAMLWVDGIAYDLNELIPRNSGIYLLSAPHINNGGEILVRGIKVDEEARPCPQFDYDPNTGEATYNDTYRCSSEYAFLLTPKGQGKRKP